MIEFKGTYHQFSKADPVAVLVQYDGLILHVWHISEPFHRMTSSDNFNIHKPFAARGHHSIKLPNGSCIKTENRHALDELTQLLDKPEGQKTAALPRSWLLALLGSMSLGIVLLWMAGF